MWRKWHNHYSWCGENAKTSQIKEVQALFLKFWYWCSLAGAHNLFTWFTDTYQSTNIMNKWITVHKQLYNKTTIRTYLCACVCPIVRNTLYHLKPTVSPTHQATLMVKVHSSSFFQILQTNNETSKLTFSLLLLNRRMLRSLEKSGHMITWKDQKIHTKLTQ